MSNNLESKIKEILAKHYADILSELETIIDSDCVELSISVESTEVDNEFECRLG